MIEYKMIATPINKLALDRIPYTVMSWIKLCHLLLLWFAVKANYPKRSILSGIIGGSGA